MSEHEGKMSIFGKLDGAVIEHIDPHSKKKATPMKTTEEPKLVQPEDPWLNIFNDALFTEL